MSRSWSVVCGLVGLVPCGSAWAQTVTNTSNGFVYATLTAAVADSSSGDELIVDAGVRSEAHPVRIVHDLTIRGAGPSATTVEVTDPAATTIFELAPGVEIAVHDLALVSVGADQGAILAEGSNTLTLEDLTIDVAFASDGAVLVYYPVSVAISRVVLTGDGGVGPFGVVGTGSEPVVLEDVTFVESDGNDLSSGIIAVAVDLRCTRCVFDHTLGEAAIFIDEGTTLTLDQSRFCSSLGTAIVGHGSGTVANTLFAGGDAALSVDEGSWTFTNDTFLDLLGPNVLELLDTATVVSTNNLFSGNVGTAITLTIPSSPPVEYNWFDLASTTGYVGGLPASNHVAEGDPGLVGWPGDCVTTTIHPRPVTSPVLDAGDPAILDVDGSRSDIGMSGGPGAVRSPIADDTDADGATFLHDCDDADPRVFPGNPEVCDEVDNDCDGAADDDDPGIDPTVQESWTPDCDGDGEGASDAVPVISCAAPADLPCADPLVGVWLSATDAGPRANSDCDDTDPTVKVETDERCEEGDQNCDGDPDAYAIDTTAFYLDADADGFGDPAAILACTAPLGTVTTSGDCDGADPSVYPGAADPCGDGVDQDCGGADGDPTNSDPWFVDGDGDGFGDPLVAPIFACQNPGGYTTEALAVDCDDTSPTVNPTAAEQCNTVDDDCDGEIDELPTATWYADEDGDGFGDPTSTGSYTCPPAGYVDAGEDCDDGDPDRNPAATERCNEVDDDCDGIVDNGRDITVWYQDADGDGHGDPASGVGALCAPDPSWVTVDDDCDDADPEVVECLPVDEPKPVAEEGAGCGCETTGGVHPWWIVLGLLLRRRRIG